MDAIAAFLLGLAQQYPVIASVFLLMGALRFVLKPLFALAHAVVDQTPSTTDNQILDNVEQSTFMKTLYFVLDWLASVKVIK
jgi:hypothetical protein